ncbi:hypothetical protein OSB04_017019 [Centaurea solstitialis]|uniref:Reverse transcriptase Ty1/copia-type domain-containing protein n=1 Tax=Centaurea solstitialis TaxID=347529 RepID=A0AA38T250_9ASTR|nr:hypothetical protein OSB04_017019 [Centaurea solstitialis]
MRKSRTSEIANAVAEIEDLVANMSLEEIDMLVVNGSMVLPARGGWYFDTRATVHVCDSRDKFFEYHEVHDGKQVNVVNKNRADVAGIGMVQLHFTSWNILTLLNVLHVLTIAKCLFSYNMLDINGFGIRGGAGVIVFVKDDRFVGRAYRDKGMYRLSLKDHADDSDSDSDDNVNEVSDDDSDDESISSNAVAVDEVTSGFDNISASFVFPVDAFEFKNGRKPNLDYFKVWGCIAYYRMPDPKRSKLGARAIKSIFVGYANNSKAYRLLDKDSGVIVESRDVDFFEDKFSEDAENSDRTLDITLPGTSRENSKTLQRVDEPHRSTRAREEKSLKDDFYSYLVEGSHKKVTREVIFSINIDDEPKTFKKAMSSRDASLWKEAINDEMNSIMGNGTWVLVDLPKGTRSIGTKWICKRKRNPDRSISAFKARLVVKGYRQKEGVDYFDTHASVARISSVRTLIAISALKDDMLIIGTDLSRILETKNYLSSYFKMKDLGEVDTILGIKGRRAVAQLEYASAIGCLIYAMHCTRPDIAFTASKKQTCIAHSTMEAEFIALAVAGKEAEWIIDLLTNLHFWPRPTPSIMMYCDSEATLSNVYNSIYNEKS